MVKLLPNCLKPCISILCIFMPPGSQYQGGDTLRNNPCNIVAIYMPVRKYDLIIIKCLQ